LQKGERKKRFLFYYEAVGVKILARFLQKKYFFKILICNFLFILKNKFSKNY
jgi:hypothetical protein